MVLANGVRRNGVGPSQVALPVKLLDDATCATRAEVGVVDASRAQQAAVWQQVRHHASLVLAVPFVDHFPAVVDEERLRRRRHR